MTNVAIITDSSSCLPPDLIQRHRIIVVPLAFLFDGELYHDGTLSGREFYQRLESARRPVTTTSPAPGEFLQAFRRARDSGARSALCLTLSSSYSGTYSSAVNGRRMAAAEMPDLQVEVLDTRGLAMMCGFAVLAAARAAEAGAPLSAAAEAAMEVSRTAHLVGVLETTRFLARSGRVPWILHWAAAALRIKPVLAASQDRVFPVARVRTMERAIEKLIDHVRRRREPSQPLRLAVMHADAPDRAAQLAGRLAAELSPHELLVTEFTSVMGVHTGPGFLGLAFYPGLPEPRPAPSPLPRLSLVERDAERLEEALGPLPEPRPVPALLVLSGLPGTGKSYLRRQLSRRYPIASVESDALRRVLFRRPRYTTGENRRLFPAMHLLLERLLSRGISVAVDATNLREDHRRPLYRIAERRGARLVVVQLTAPEDVIRRRLQDRARGLDPEDISEADPYVYQKMRRELQPISYPHTVIDTSQDIAPAIDDIVRRLGGA